MKTDLSGASAPLRVSPLVADGLLIRQDEYYKKYFYAEILWIEASGNYCYFHFKDNSRITVACRLGSVEWQLLDAYLVRVHRGFILNLRYVDTWAEMVPGGGLLPEKRVGLFQYTGYFPGKPENGERGVIV